MNDTMRMLLYSDGSQLGSQALRLGMRIAVAMANAVDILVIAETADQERAASQEVTAAAEKLEAAGVSVTIHRRPGTMLKELLNQAELTDYDLIVVGSRGRRGIRRLVAGSRACSILKGTTTSILVVKGREREEIDHILVGSAAGPASEDTVRFAARLARALDASVTLLHVMSQVALEEHAKAADLEAEADELMESDAREGIHLEDMLEILHQENVQAKALVRHGLIVDEILAEAKSGHFDIIVIGAHAAPGVEGLLSSDLSEQIMLSAERPILIVHQARET
ncbi:MAG: universal stress protein [Chloroflexota bacterium]|nr:universal stress protein [Chloroflexota bacterium]